MSTASGRERTKPRLSGFALRCSIIDYPDIPENRDKIEAIRVAWKQKTGDQSVMRVTEPADVSFWFQKRRR